MFLYLLSFSTKQPYSVQLYVIYTKRHKSKAVFRQNESRQKNVRWPTLYNLTCTRIFHSWTRNEIWADSFCHSQTTRDVLFWLYANNGHKQRPPISHTCVAYGLTGWHNLALMTSKVTSDFPWQPNKTVRNYQGSSLTPWRGLTIIYWSPGLRSYSQLFLRRSSPTDIKTRRWRKVL